LVTRCGEYIAVVQPPGQPTRRMHNKYVRTRELGRTGLTVSQLALGTVELGLDYGIGTALKPAEQDASDLLHYALDQGITVIDTARAYGSAERIIGQTLEERRDEYVLVSKVKSAPGEVETLVEASLRELRTDRIDVMMLHCGFDSRLDEDALGALERCRDAGKLRFIGASVYGMEAAMNAIRSARCDCIEIAYSVLDRRPESEVLAAADAAGVGVIARSVLLKGALSVRYRDLAAGLESLQSCVERLAAIAGSIDLLPEFAYRYVLSRRPPHCALVGTSSREELRAAVCFAEKGPLPAEQVRAAQKVELDDERWLNPGHWPSPDRA
jgi:aryl-alcohol dehydrogenase-like predicted oxidoreductase